MSKNQKINQCIEQYIEQFQRWGHQHAGPVPWSLRFSGSDLTYPHIYFSACVHGNEIGSLPAIMNFIEKLIDNKNHYPGTLTFSLGNVEAMKANVRFLQVDMNRHFGDKQSKEPESLRANDLCQLIDDCDIFIDLHQTIEPTSEPFYVISDTLNNRMWSQALAVANKAILRNPKVDTYLTATTYAYKKQKIASTIELSQKGFNDFATQLCENILNKTLELAIILKDNFNLEKFCKNTNTLSWLIMAHYEKFDGPFCQLNPGWKNLSPIKKGEIYGKNQEGKPLVSPIDGFTLFPKYVDRDSAGAAIGPLPKDIMTLTQVISH
ncbi:MAG: succinylglutamate desuccinylase/aspartoacylase family protein [Bdellovibrionaceae bacterium]|nr:succinylglutamate desuccinylase/aspartoacylase family protein [Pseudobdellovibrionaceae bacterium]